MQILIQEGWGPRVCIPKKLLSDADIVSMVHTLSIRKLEHFSIKQEKLKSRKGKGCAQEHIAGWAQYIDPLPPRTWSWGDGEALRLNGGAWTGGDRQQL